MPIRHIRDRELKPLEWQAKTESARKARLDEVIRKNAAQAAQAAAKPVMNIPGIPGDILGLAGVGKEELAKTYEDIGKITRSVGMLNMNNPIMQSAGALSLAYMLKPELVKDFVGSPFGSTALSGAGSFMLGRNVGGMVGDSALLSTGGGAATGYAFGSVVGSPITGMLFGAVGGIMGGRSRRRAKRLARERLENAWNDLEKSRGRALDAQAELAGMRDVRNAAFDSFLDRTDMAMQSLLSGKAAIETQRKRLDELRDINIGIIAQNRFEIDRVANIKNQTIREETKKMLARQRVQIGVQNISDAGSSWYILGETESMGSRAEQEAYLERKAALAVEEQHYRQLMNDYDDMSNQLTNYSLSIDLQAKTLESDVKKAKTEFETGMNALDIERRKINDNIEDLTKRMYGLAGKHSEAGGAALRIRREGDEMNFENKYKYSTFAKEQRLLEKAEKKAGALALVSLGDAIRTTKAGVNPFDELVTYDMFSH